MLRPRDDPSRRRLARLWIEAAPSADSIWEFASSRPPNPAVGTLEMPIVDGELMPPDPEYDLDELKDYGVEVETVALADMRAQPSWNPDYERADVRAWHPAFARLAAEDAQDVAQSTIASLLGDEDELRWLGGVVVDPNLGGGLELPALKPWFDHQALTTTGDRWLIDRRRDQRGRNVVLRFNAAQKPMDLPPASYGLLLALQRTVEDVEAPEAPETIAAISELTTTLNAATVRLFEVGESSRLTLVFVAAAPWADEIAARKWAGRFPKLHVGVASGRVSSLSKQMQLSDVGRSRDVPWDAALPIKTRDKGPLYDRAHSIVRNPRRLFAGPLFVEIGALLLGVAVPSLAHEAALQVIGILGVTGVLIALYQAASTYVTVRDSAALGCLAILIDGWKILVILGISLALILIYVVTMFSS
jgi:hypothetical protein